MSQQALPLLPIRKEKLLQIYSNIEKELKGGCHYNIYLSGISFINKLLKKYFTWGDCHKQRMLSPVAYVLIHLNKCYKTGKNSTNPSRSAISRKESEVNTDLENVFDPGEDDLTTSGLEVTRIYRRPNRVGLERYCMWIIYSLNSSNSLYHQSSKSIDRVLVHPKNNNR